MDNQLIIAANQSQELIEYDDDAHISQEPKVSEIAERLGMTEEEIKDSMKNSPKHLSMDASLTSDDDTNMYDVLRNEDTVAPDKELIYQSLQQEIASVIDTLPTREAEILKLFYGLGSKHPMTLDEIGEQFDLSRERVRQIKEKAIRRLRHNAKCKSLQAYL